MPSAEAEVYFIGAMMILILVISLVTMFYFIRQYKKEMIERAERAKAKVAAKEAAKTVETAEKV